MQIGLSLYIFGIWAISNICFYISDPLLGVSADESLQ